MAKALNAVLTRTLSPKAIEDTARQFGAWRDGGIVVDSDEARDLLNDVALYDYVPVGGKNAVARFASRAGDLGSDERLVIEAMSEARFTLVELGERVEGVGVHTSDMLTDQPFFLADVSLSHTASPGLVITARILSFDDFSMTSGVFRIVANEIATVVAESFATARKEKGLTAPWSARDRATMAAVLVQLSDISPDQARQAFGAPRTELADRMVPRQARRARSPRR